MTTSVSREERLADVLLESSSSDKVTSERSAAAEESKPMEMFTTMDTPVQFSARAINGFYSGDLTTEKVRSLSSKLCP